VTSKKEKEIIIKRPYATKYYTGLAVREDAYSTQGAATTEQGAIRATVVRIFMSEYAKAVIFDRRTNVPIYTVKIGVHGIQVHYGSAVLNDVADKLRRIK